METDSTSVTFSSSHWDTEISPQLVPLAVVRSSLSVLEAEDYILTPVLFSCVRCLLSCGCVSTLSPATLLRTRAYRLFHECDSPIMASFAVQTVTQVFTKLSTWQLDRRRAADGIRNTASAFTTDYGLPKSARSDPGNSRSRTTPASKRTQVREKARQTVGSERMKGEAEGWERGQRGGMWRNLWRCGGEREGKAKGEKSAKRGEREMEEAGVGQGEEPGGEDGGGDIEKVRDRGERGVQEEMLETEKVYSLPYTRERQSLTVTLTIDLRFRRSFRTVHS